MNGDDILQTIEFLQEFAKKYWAKGKIIQKHYPPYDYKRFSDGEHIHRKSFTRDFKIEEGQWKTMLSDLLASDDPLEYLNNNRPKGHRKFKPLTKPEERS